MGQPFVDMQPFDPRWHLNSRDHSGVFAISRAGAILFRVEYMTSGLMLFMWDKKENREIPIALGDLQQKVLTFYGKL